VETATPVSGPLPSMTEDPAQVHRISSNGQVTTSNNTNDGHVATPRNSDVGHDAAPNTHEENGQVTTSNNSNDGHVATPRKSDVGHDTASNTHEDGHVAIPEPSPESQPDAPVEEYPELEVWIELDPEEDLELSTIAKEHSDDLNATELQGGQSDTVQLEETLIGIPITLDPETNSPTFKLDQLDSQQTSLLQDHEQTEINIDRMEHMAKFVQNTPHLHSYARVASVNNRTINKELECIKATNEGLYEQLRKVIPSKQPTTRAQFRAATRSQICKTYKDCL
jgi:hypothetical protein